MTDFSIDDVDQFEDELSRMQIDNEAVLVDVLYTPEGDFNMDPGQNPITYALMRIRKTTGAPVLIGALWMADTGATGFFPTTSSGAEGQDWQSIWNARSMEARMKYGKAGDPWDAESWFDYWLQQISGVGEIAFESGFTGDYQETLDRMMVM
jgi:hypothetical protein